MAQNILRVEMYSQHSRYLLHLVRSASRSEDVKSSSEFLPRKPSFGRVSNITRNQLQNQSCDRLEVCLDLSRSM
jgi:hypothetical protein